MSDIDEVYVNPRQPDDVSFGESIIVPLSGQNGKYSASYIKTDRTGNMTHYLEPIDAFPLQNYKCAPGRSMQENADIRFVKPIAVRNTNDSEAIDFNNIDTYGDHLISSETLIKTPTQNPLSVTLGEFFNYAEIQMDFKFGHTFTSLELMYQLTGISDIEQLMARIYAYDIADDRWNRITGYTKTFLTPTIPQLDPNLLYYHYDLPASIQTDRLRLRFINASNPESAINMKLMSTLYFYQKIS